MKKYILVYASFCFYLSLISMDKKTMMVSEYSLLAQLEENMNNTKKKSWPKDKLIKINVQKRSEKNRRRVVSNLQIVSYIKKEIQLLKLYQKEFEKIYDARLTKDFSVFDIGQADCCIGDLSVGIERVEKQLLTQQKLLSDKNPTQFLWAKKQIKYISHCLEELKRYVKVAYSLWENYKCYKGVAFGESTDEDEPWYDQGRVRLY